MLKFVCHSEQELLECLQLLCNNSVEISVLNVLQD